MRLITKRSELIGKIKIPASKSHTIRAIALSSLAEGRSSILLPLVSSDTLSAVMTYIALGAKIDTSSTERWVVEGFAARPSIPQDVINVGNSGTTLNIAVGTAALLQNGYAIFTGDEQIRRRPSGPLIKSINDLGGLAFSSRENDLPPFIVKGTLRGGKTQIDATSSQYLTSLLINTPFSEAESSEITVGVLNERPYVEMTLSWLDKLNIDYESSEDLKYFRIPGRQRIRGFECTIPADWSSATFFLCAAAIAGKDVTIEGLDLNDTQGDKAVLDYLRQMGAEIKIENDKIIVKKSNLIGKDLDLNATPDALPAMAVVACFAKGKTTLYNVPQARIKETDRIAVMHEELTKLGGKITEMADGLTIEGNPLKGGVVDGRKDHRVIMALSIAGLATEEPVEVLNAEAIDVTFPNFPQLLESLGAEIKVLD